MSVIAPGSKLPKRITLDELKNMLEAMPQSIKERADSLVKSATIGDPDNPTIFLLDKSQIEEWGELGLEAVCTLLAMYNNIQVITQEHTKYREVKTLVQSHK